MEYTKSFYSPHEVAEMADVHPSTILNYIASGRLYAVRLSSRTFRIPVRAVVGLLEPERLTPPIIEVDTHTDVETELALLEPAQQKPATREGERALSG